MTDHEGNPLATSDSSSDLLRDSEHSWKEDYPDENGKHHHTCQQCGAQFIGHKRRMICKVCSDRAQSERARLSSEEQEKPMLSRSEVFLTNPWVVFSPCLIQAGSFFVYLLGLATYWDRPAGMPELDDLMQPALVMTFVVIPAVGLVQAYFGLMRYFRSRIRRFLLFVISFAVILILALGALVMISMGAYLTV